MGSTREYQFVTGPETSEIPTAGTPTEDGDTISKGYADDNYMQGQKAVADITALKAVAEADRVDKNCLYVDAEDEIFVFDSGSSATGDDISVVVPTAGSGRWLRLGQKTYLGNQAGIRFYELTASGSNYVGFIAPDSVTANTLFKLPDGDGIASQVLSTDGNKNLSWATGLTSLLNEYNIRVGNSSNAATPVNTNLLGDYMSSVGSNVVTFDYTGHGDGEDRVLWTAHTLELGDTVYFTNSGGALPTGISASTKYWVTDPQTNSFSISDGSGGADVEFTDDGSGTSTVYFGGINLSPDDSTQTKYGRKTYQHGTTYKDGIAPTITGSAAGTVVRAIFRPFQMQDGSWWVDLKVNYKLSVSDLDAYLDVNGMTFKNVTNFYQPLAARHGTTDSLRITCYATPNTSRIQFTPSPGSNDEFFANGICELESKPTWAY